MLKRCSYGYVLRNFKKFTAKHLCQSLFFNKVAGLYIEHFWCLLATLLKKRLWHRCFSGNVLKSLKAPFLQNVSGNFVVVVAVDSILMRENTGQ